MWVLYKTVVMKWELNLKVKLSVYQLIYILPFIYGHEPWVVTR